MTKTFYYVRRHGESDIGAMRFTRFGEVAEFDEKLITDAVRGGAAFIPEADFLALKFDSKDVARVQQYPFARMPREFEAKAQKAEQTYRDLLALLRKDPLYLTTAVEETVEQAAPKYPAPAHDEPAID